ncbi:hypothetical protein EDD16DRAFT_1498280, partial [Pisolithus croceorrhizus]
VRTHWDLTYFMINCFHTLHQAIKLFLAAPQNADVAQHKLEPLDWEVLQDLEFILEAPSLAQHAMSGEQSPLLGGALPTFETFMTQW